MDYPRCYWTWPAVRIKDQTDDDYYCRAFHHGSFLQSEISSDQMDFRLHITTQCSSRHWRLSSGKTSQNWNWRRPSVYFPSPSVSVAQLRLILYVTFFYLLPHIPVVWTLNKARNFNRIQKYFLLSNHSVSSLVKIFSCLASSEIWDELEWE